MGPHAGSVGRRVRSVVGITGLVVVVVAGGIAPSSAAARSRDARVTQREGAVLGDAFLRWTNSIRRRHDLRVLRPDRALSRYATRHSELMAERRRLFHSSDARLVDALRGTGWSASGENVGSGPTLRDVQRAFMRSAPHRANILRRRFDHVGIGVTESRRGVWITSIFYG